MLSNPQDNFAHDIVRYHNETHQPYQTFVAVDASGDYHELFQPVHDPLISSYLRIRAQTAQARPYSSRWSRFRASLPFAPNLSPPHYVPTRMYDLLTRLRSYFPRHRLLLSDFAALPEAVPGHDAPVVQTRYRGQMIPVTTYLVAPGYFDIFFPTDFELLRDVYERVMFSPSAVAELQDYGGRGSPLASTATSLELGAQYFFFKGRRAPVDGVISASGLPVGPRFSSVFTHKEFLSQYPQYSDKTKLRNGENPMIEMYQNVKFLF